MVPDNCPELRPELSWLGHEGLGEPAVLGRLREDEGTWVQVSLLHFVPTREANGHRLGCQAAFPNTTLQFEGYASLDVKCEPGCGLGQGRGLGERDRVGSLGAELGWVGSGAWLIGGRCIGVDLSGGWYLDGGACSGEPRLFEQAGGLGWS